MARTQKPLYVPVKAKTLALNRRARRDYDIIETLEVGIVLYGSEIKSLRENQVQIDKAWAHVRDNELWLHNLHISPYSHSVAYAPESDRVRKLLAHRREISNLQNSINQKRLTLIPLALYLRNRRAKLTLALAKGRKQTDKRQQLAQREAERTIAEIQRHQH